MMEKISIRNIRLFNITQLLYALFFTIPIWVVYYQGRVSIAEMSLLVGIQYASQLIFELPTGAFADLLGRKKSIALGYACWAIFNGLVVVSTGFPSLIIATIIAGLGESLISGSLEALVYDSLQQDKREAEYSHISARNGLYFQIALAIATFSGGFLYQLWWALPYVACAVMNCIAAFLSCFFIEPKIDSEKFSLKGYVSQIKNGTIHAFETKKVALMSMFYIVVSAITWTNNVYFFDYILVELKFNDIQRSVYGAIIRIINIVILGNLLRNEHIFTRTRSIFFFPIVMTLCFIPGIFFQGIWALPFIAGAVMAGTGRWIVLSKYTNDMFSSKYRATAISALSMIVGILFVLITFISGPIIENFGGVKTMYTIMGVTTFLTVLPLAFAVVRDEENHS